ncbi:hypothetical protein [Nocardioides hwasunensis]|uniref:Uncharacterized protein n=1 Tax=Nocardioides hwasunensis TaxID=397258 RepID=A0ABR8MKR1_9ACTN|nr:hypothetical protein [Nocardioides hwasunensis]MBD3916577.1 hypothetical protein [Nocardioides hwasunensis]
MTVLEKLLVPEVSRRIVEQGYDVLTGPVYRPEDHIGLTPVERVRALGLDGPDGPFGEAPDHVDVVRFGTHPLMDLRVPTNALGHADVPWPTYPTGFLRDGTATWILTMTRMPVSARYVRVGLDGTEREFSRYLGAARGWQGAKGYFPPLHLIGPRARFGALDLPCSYTADQQSVELVWVGDDQVPEGFEPVRPMVHSRTAPVSACEVFDIALVARWRDHRVRVLQQAGDEVLVVVTPDSAADAAELGATEVEPGVFQATVAAGELADREGVRSDPMPTQSRATHG